MYMKLSERGRGEALSARFCVGKRNTAKNFSDVSESPVLGTPGTS